MFNRFLSVKIASQGPDKFGPDACFVHGCFCPHGRFVLTDVLSRTFCPTDVLSLRTFCPHGRFVPTDVLSTDILSSDVLSPDVLSGHLKFVSNFRKTWVCTPGKFFFSFLLYTNNN
jgi:hypothetical protein